MNQSFQSKGSQSKITDQSKKNIFAVFQLDINLKLNMICNVLSIIGYHQSYLLNTSTHTLTFMWIYSYSVDLPSTFKRYIHITQSFFFLLWDPTEKGCYNEHMTFGLVGITSAHNLDAQVCLGKIPLFIEKMILIRNGKKGTLDYQISAAYQIKIWFEMT